MIREYLEHGFVLVPFARGTKGPEGPSSLGWNKREKCISDPKYADRIKENVGIAHAYSRTCSIDLDNLDEATTWLAARGIMVGALLEEPESVRISSGRPNRAKLLYRLPDGVEPLRTKQIKDDAKKTILEFRCATATGSTVQCVLPPSIHPDTGQPYRWEYGDDLLGDWRSLPPLPGSLLKLWESLVTPTAAVGLKTAITAHLGHVSELLKRTECPAGYNDWYPFLMCVHNLTDGSEEGLQLVIEWSAAGADFAGADVITSKWNKFDGKRPEYGIEWLESKSPGVVAAIDEFEVIDVGNNSTTSAQVVPNLPAFKRDRQGRIEATIGNVLKALRSTDAFDIRIRRDTFRDEIMLAKAGEVRPLKDADYVRIREEFERRSFKSIGRELMRDAVLEVADANAFDSAQAWLNGLKWDGVPRVDTFFEHYFCAAPSPYTTAVSRYLLTALAGRVLEPGCKADMVPVLYGEQGCGKSRGVEALAPEPAHETKIDLSERDDNLARAMRGRLIGEIAELKGLQQREAGSIKAFLSQSTDSWIPKYVEFSTTYPRRIIFIGTTNEDEFLADETGNRRWLPIHVGRVLVEEIRRDKLQLWAEAALLFTVGGIAHQDAERLGRPEHGQYEVSDLWEDQISTWLDGTDDLDASGTSGTARKMRPVTVAELAVNALSMDLKSCGKTQQRRIGGILRKLGFANRSYRTERGYRKMWCAGSCRIVPDTGNYPAQTN